MTTVLPDISSGITSDTLNRLRTNPESISYLQNTHFQFVIQRIPNFVFFCQSATIPSVSSTQAEQPTGRFIPINHPGENFTFGELNVSFLVDEYMKSWLEIYDWMRSIKAVDSYEEFKPEETHYSDASVIVYNNQSNPILEVRFKDIFPTSLSEISFNSSETNTTPIVSTATFTYTGYEIIKLPLYG